MNGKWIMITGATDGIGKATAEILASRGHKLYLLGRNIKKLNEVADKIRTDKNEIKLIECDLSRPINSSIFKDIELGMLINNAGVCSTYFSFIFEDQTDDIINVNIKGTIELTKMLISRMIDNKFGYVINIGSIAGEIPMPLISTYCASKNMLKMWSESMYYELRNFNVHVECILPGYVTTKLTGNAVPGLFKPTPMQFADSLLKTIGTSKITYPYFLHLITRMIFEIFPKFIGSRIIFYYFGKFRRMAIDKGKIKS